jgi:BESS motif.
MRDYYRLELRKLEKQKSGSGTHQATPFSSWPHFTVMSFLKDILKSGTGCTGLGEETYPQNSQCEVTVYDADGSEVTVIKSESTVQPTRPSSRASNEELSAPKKKRPRQETESIIRKNEDIINLEKKKPESTDKERAAEEDDDLLYLKSLLPYIKSLPRIRRLRLRSKFQELVIQELEELECSTRVHPASVSLY